MTKPIILLYNTWIAVTNKPSSNPQGIIHVSDLSSIDDPRLGLGLRAYMGAYDLILCDVWGVIYDGLEICREAAQALAAARAAGVIVCLFSNAPRPSATLEAQLRAFGLPDRAWDIIVTSGECTLAQLQGQFRNQPCYVIGPDRDHDLLVRGQVNAVAEEAARFVLCTGFFDEEGDQLEDYRALFDRLIARGLFFLCANPDRIVMRGAHPLPCAGALADLYAACGGTVIFAGKPEAPIYQLAVTLAGAQRGHPIAAERVLCIGDAIPTDLKGAAMNGFDALFICNGIHAAIRSDEADAGAAVLFEPFMRICQNQGVAPIGYMAKLVW